MRKSRLNIIVYLVFLFIALTFSLFMRADFKRESSNQSDLPNKQPLDSTIHVLSPFVINDSGGGDYTWAEAVNEDWCSGSGIYGDPYIIENLFIDGGSLGECLEISNSNKYFILKNCTFIVSAGSLVDYTLRLFYVSNGTILNNTLNYIGPFNATGPSGMMLFNCDNMTVRNNTFKNYYWCFRLIESDENLLVHNNFLNNSHDLSLFNGCDNNTITNNAFRGNIFLETNCNFNRILSNTLSTARIIIDDADYTYIFQNNITSSVTSGILVSNSIKINISENNIKNNTENGIYLDSNNCTILNNKISNNQENGIYIKSDNCDIVGNDIDDNENGIYIHGGVNSEIHDNNLTANGISFNTYLSISKFSTHTINKSNKVNGKPVYYYVNQNNLSKYNFSNAGQVILFNCNDSIINEGDLSEISLYYSNNISILDNNITLNKINGIYTRSCNYINVSRNNITGYEKGCYFYDSDINWLSNNIIKNTDIGVHIKWGDNYSLFDNIITNSEEIGIWIQQGENFTLSANEMDKGGLSVDGNQQQLSRFYVDTKNTINNQTIYYYVDREYLNYRDLNKSGQVILINCNHSVIENYNLTVVSNGIFVYIANNLTIRSNNLSYNSQDGISLVNCENVNITKNTVNDNVGYGLYISSGTNYNISDNLFCNNEKDGIYSSSSLNNISLNDIINNGNNGIQLTEDNNHISNNQIFDNEEYGIYLYSSSNDNNISENSIINNKIGIRIYDNSDRNKILDNIIENNENIGVSISESNQNNISSNTIRNNQNSGIYLIGFTDPSNLNILAENTITNNSNYGIYIDMGCSSNEIVYNNISQSTTLIYLSYHIVYPVEFNKIIGNEFREHSNYGVYVLGSDSEIYSNYFLGSGLFAYDNGGVNHWDNGSVGNYWINYAGEDNNDDGIGDSIYTYNTITDNYPLWWDAPLLKIITPTQKQGNTDDPPEFIIEIRRGIAVSMWYTLNNGKKNYFSVNSTISKNSWQDIWDESEDGDLITVGFFIQDGRGYITSETVLIEIEKKVESERDIVFDILLVLLIIISSVALLSVGVLVYRKKLFQKRDDSIDKPIEDYNKKSSLNSVILRCVNCGSIMFSERSSCPNCGNSKPDGEDIYSNLESVDVEEKDVSLGFSFNKCSECGWILSKTTTRCPRCKHDNS